MPHLTLISTSYSYIYTLLDAYASDTISIPSKNNNIDDCVQIYLYARFPASSIIGQINLYPKEDQYQHLIQKIPEKSNHSLELKKLIDKTNLAYGGIYKTNKINYRTLKNILPNFKLNDREMFHFPEEVIHYFLF